MASFFESRRYTAQTLKRDFENMKNLSQSDALSKSNSTDEKMSRIPLVLTKTTLYYILLVYRSYTIHMEMFFKVEFLWKQSPERSKINAFGSHDQKCQGIRKLLI